MNTVVEAADVATIRARIEAAAAEYPLCPGEVSVVTELIRHLVLSVPTVADLLAWTDHLAGDVAADAHVDRGRVLLQAHGKCRLLGWTISVTCLDASAVIGS